MREVFLAALGLVSSLPAYAATVDEFDCSIFVFDSHGNSVAAATQSAHAVRKSLSTLPPSTQGWLSMSLDVPGGITSFMFLDYKHFMGSGVEKAWQSACIGAQLCVAGHCSGSSCVTDIPVSPGDTSVAPWVEVPITNGIPDFVGDVNKALSIESYHAKFSCTHKNTIP